MENQNTTISQEQVTPEQSVTQSQEQVTPEQPPTQSKTLNFKLLIIIGAAAVATLALILTAIILVSCSPVNKVNRYIDQLGSVDLGSESVLIKAEEGLAELSESEKLKVKNTEQLTAARAEFNTLKDVYDAIEGIGEVTSEKEDSIEKARNKYDDLEDDQKAKITNIASLEAAEKTLSDTKVKDTIASIDAIGTVSLDSRSKIDAANEKFNDLSAEEKANVTNSAALTSALSEYKRLATAAAKDKLAVLEADHDSVDNVTWYMPKAIPDYIDTRCYVLPYIGYQGNSYWLLLRTNYTGDDWIFWKNIKIVADDQVFYLSANYFDITRDNESGLVWEFYDFNDIADEEIYDISKAIATSKKTTVRFIGDDYHYDHIVSENDKIAIKQVLSAYDLVKMK